MKRLDPSAFHAAHVLAQAFGRDSNRAHEVIRRCLHWTNSPAFRDTLLSILAELEIRRDQEDCKRDLREKEKRIRMFERRWGQR